MKRPVLLRLLPDRLRISVWARCYRQRRERWLGLYRDAELRYAPGVTMELVPGDVISDCIAFTGVYELGLTRRVMELAKITGTFVEIGANLGYFTLLWAAAHPENRCIVFEASPRNIDLLRRNVERNGLGSRIEIVPHAAGSAPGKLRFDLGPADQTGWGGFAPENAVGGIEVDVVRADSIVPTDKPIALLKVDVEGADAWALMGCEGLLTSRLVREIRFEQNKTRMKALGLPESASQDYLRSVGYVCEPLGEAGADLVDWRSLPE
jgi:FkbM family methyltransferase